ncbi:hypothetical protein [Pseudomonas syringae]|uniref:Lipoprotein n=1 Tax=Pseudomonas syringae TaxID=317 RepID=A0A085V3Y6_PSESX|nr:hypothetical protein [Pseudomonas syringae]KFE50149.1 hypothetical protein IV01_26115 [Pseudomonas syringae]
MSGNGMRVAFAVLGLLVLGGCTHNIQPVVKDQGLYVTKIKDQKAQIVASQEFQRLTIQGVPLRSSNWKGQKFNVAIGKPVTDGIYSYVGSTFSDTRIGDTKDGDKSGITLTLSDVSVELWIDDDSSFTSQLLFAPSYYMNKVDAQANVVVSGSLLLPTGEARAVRVTGHGLKNLKPASMDADVIEEVTGLAAGDAAKQIVELMRGSLSKH